MTVEKQISLNDAQRRFCDEYLVDFNAGAAYQRSGYKSRGRSADACASRLLTKPEVAAYLSERKKVLAAETGLSLARITQELKAIALMDPRKLYDDAGAVLAPKDWPDDVAAAVAGIDVTEISEQRGGKKVRIGQTRKLNLWNKLDAIEKALKLLNAYPERKQDGPRETIVGVVVLPAKRPYQGHQQQAIEGQARQIQRTQPLPPSTKRFIVPRA